MIEVQHRFRYGKMAKIKTQKKKKVQKQEKPENEEVALPSTRKSDDPIPNKVFTYSIYLRPLQTFHY